jgi:hypothetical protein
MTLTKFKYVALVAAFSAGAASPSSVTDYYVPQYYPAPYGGWVKDWQESYRKARDLVASMTLAEKTNITAGSGIFMGKAHIRPTAVMAVGSKRY